MKLNEFCQKQHLVEYKRDITTQRLGSKLEQAAMYDRKQSIDEVLAGLESMDPTKNKKYTEWLARQYIARQFKLEDSAWVNDILTKFDHVKNKLPTADINRYTFHSLDTEMDKVYKADVLPSEDTDTSVDGAITLYNGPLGKLYHLEAKEASCKLGRGTKWCTAATKSDNAFDWYNSYGDLYLWIDKSGQKHQFYIPVDTGSTHEFMDSKNQEISASVLTEFLTKNPVLTNFFKSIFEKRPKLAYDIAKYFHVKVPIIENVIARSADLSYLYAHLVLNGRFPKGEPAIGTSPRRSLNYAEDVIKGRFPKGELAIASNSSYAYVYADEILKAPWPLGEPAIAEDAEEAYSYAKNVLKGPFPKGEPAIGNDTEYAFLYAEKVLHGRFPGGESAIAADDITSFSYAEKIIKGPFPEGEPAIAEDAGKSFSYAKEILHGRFKLGEPAMATQGYYAYRYAHDILKGRFPEGEEILAVSPSFGYEYARNIIKGRFPKGEPAIRRDDVYREYYNELMKELGINFQL